MSETRMTNVISSVILCSWSNDFLEESHMDKIIDKGLMFALGCLLLWGTDSFVEPVLAILIALVYFALSCYLTDKRGISFLMILMAGISFYWKELSAFLPLL